MCGGELTINHLPLNGIMDNNDKNVNLKELFLSGVYRGKALYGAIWTLAIVLALLNLFDFFSTVVGYGNVLVGAALFVLGIPLSVFLRMDVLEEIMGITNIQLVLFIGSVITFINIALILGCREVLLGVLRKRKI